MGSSAHAESILAGGNPLHDSVSLILVQAALILIISRLLDWSIFRFFKAPLSVSEVVTGIILGQSILSNIPDYEKHIFNLKSVETLTVVSDIGLILSFFMVFIYSV